MTERVINLAHVTQLGTGFNNCGEAALAMVLNTWLATMNVSERIELANVIRAVNNNGKYASMADLKRASATFGLTLLIRAQQSLDTLVSEINAGRLVIALVHRQKLNPTFGNFNGSHFVVVSGYDAEHVIIHDPLSPVGGAGDAWRVPTADFKAAWATTPGNGGQYQALFADPVQWKAQTPPITPPLPPKRTALVIAQEIRVLTDELIALSE